MSDSCGKAQPPVSFFYILALVTFSVGTASVSFCSNQVLQLTLRQFTTQMKLIGFVMSLQALNQLWATPYAAWKSDRIWTRIGRRKPLVVIMAPALALTIVLVPHCPALWLLVALVFVLQMAEDAELAVIMPAISDSVPDKQRPLATGMWQFAVAIAAFLMGRYVMKLMEPGEHVLRLAGFSLTIQGAHHWPYTVAGMIIVVTSAVFLLVMREKYVAPRPHDKFRLFSYGKDIVQVREHLLIYVIFFAQPLFYLVAIAFFATLAKVELHISPARYGWAFSYGAITTLIASIPLGYLFNRFRHRKAFCIGACVYVLIPITYGLFYMKTATDMAIFFSMQILAFIVFRLNFMPLVMEYTTPQNVGTIMGFTNAVNGMVRFTALPLVGWIVDATHGSCRLPLWGGYVGAAVCIIALVMMRPPEMVKHLLE
ncbi:MAG: MFS transporter [Armatimonadetes bacterium]|nr:MFS transporter [Armatimonadota bacterium]